MKLLIFRICKIKILILVEDSDDNTWLDRSPPSELSSTAVVEEEEVPPTDTDTPVEAETSDSPADSPEEIEEDEELNLTLQQAPSLYRQNQVHASTQTEPVVPVAKFRIYRPWD